MLQGYDRGDEKARADKTTQGSTLKKELNTVMIQGYHTGESSQPSRKESGKPSRWTVEWEREIYSR